MTRIDDSIELAVINDRFRKDMGQSGISGHFLATPGVMSLPEEDRAAVLNSVITFDAFTDDNDPHGEHDFGNFMYKRKSYFWKIDYYAPDMQGGSEDPADVSKTVRVLTVLLAAEW